MVEVNKVYSVDISRKDITSLRDLNKKNTTFVKRFNEITELDCSYNNLTDLEGCPPNVIKLTCDNNKLISFKGMPPSVKLLNCCNNNLTTFKYCSPNITILWGSNNAFDTLDGCPDKCLSVAAGLLSSSAICNIFLENKKLKNKIDEIKK